MSLSFRIVFAVENGVCYQMRFERSARAILLGKDEMNQTQTNSGDEKPNETRDVSRIQSFGRTDALSGLKCSTRSDAH